MSEEPDVVERLNEALDSVGYIRTGGEVVYAREWMREAADAITALRAERDRAVEMLEMMQEWCDGGRIQSFPLGDGYGDYRPAHAEWADDARALIAEIDGEG